jgi:hypothetical protein
MAEPTLTITANRSCEWRSERTRVGIVLERRPARSPWAADGWRVVEILPGVVETPPWSVLAAGEGWQRIYAGDLPIELFRTETAGYRDNLISAAPSLWIVLRRGGPYGITLHEASVDPGEIEAHSDAGDDLVEAVPLPPMVAAWVQSFVDRHHVERPFWKRQRDRADPEALAHRRRTALGASGHG